VTGLFAFKKVLVAILLFTLMWTGTFLHDQFAPPADVGSTTALQLSFDKQDTCPCVSHLHSPLVAPTVKDSCEHLLTHFLPILSAFLLDEETIQLAENTARPAMTADAGSACKRPAYIVYRSLLL
jgi:hypothetical protein